MLTLHKDTLFIVLMALLAITLLSWFMPYGAPVGRNALGAALLILAFVKVQLILSQYMELAKAALAVRLAFAVWVVAVCAITIGIYV